MLTYVHMCVHVCPDTCKPCIHVYSNKKIEKGRKEKIKLHENVRYTTKGLSLSIEHCLQLKSGAGPGSVAQSVKCLLHTHEG